MNDESSAQPSGWSDAELIRAVAYGDEAAHSVLCERHAAAALRLAETLASGSAETESIVSATFARLYHALREGGLPRAALRPSLFTAIRQVAYQRLAGDTGQALPEQALDLGEPLFTDPAIADHVRSPLCRAYWSLLERQQAALWHAAIEQCRPAEIATILGLAPDGVEALAGRAREDLRQACLSQYLTDVTDAECRSALAALGTSHGDPPSEPGELAGTQHLESCASCQAAAHELADLDGALRRVVAPVFLGAAATAYLSATPADTAPAGLDAGVLNWTQQSMPSASRAPRQRRVLLGGGAVLGAFAAAGIALVLVSTSSAPPSHPASRPAAAVGRPDAQAGSLSPVSPSPARKSASRTPAAAARHATPGATPSRTPASPAPSSPAPTSVAPTSPSPTAATPSPCPTLPNGKCKPKPKG